MAIRERVDSLAKTLVLTDESDLGRLVSLQEELQNLRDEVDAGELAALHAAADKASELVQGIVLRDIEDVSAAFEHVKDAIEYAQKVVESLDRGDSIDSIAPPSFGEEGAESAPPPVEEIDEDLLSAWISECELKLSELEPNVVDIEQSDSPDEIIAEVRRTIHTIKGECGVLSLHIAQKLCHEAESAIDRCTEQNIDFPVDNVLALLDWLRSYVNDLSQDSRANPPDHLSLIRKLIESGAPQSSDDSADESATKTRMEAPAAEAETTSDTSSPSSQSSPEDGEPVEFPPDLSADENLNDFMCEAREHIAAAEEALLSLEQDFTDSELINSVFRAFHTIKGVAGFLHLGPIVEVAHNAEYLLDEARKESLTLTSALLDLILNTCDMMATLLAALEGADPPTKGQIRILVERLQAATRGEAFEPATAAKPGAPAAAPAELPYPPLGEILVHMGIVSAEQVTEALKKQQHGAEKLRDILVEADLENVDLVESEIVKPNSANGTLICQMLVEMQLVDEAELASAIEAKKDSDKRLGALLGLAPGDLAPALREQRSAQRASEESLDDSMPAPKPAAAPSSTSGSATPASLQQPDADRKRATKSAAADNAKKRADQTVKVSTERMDSLVTMVGELVIAHQMVVQDPCVLTLKEQRFQRNVTHVGKIIRDLQEVAMSLRLVTVRATFQKMARLVRDVSAKAGKSIRFNMEGEDTELDRTVVDEIGDPLVHMIRNSCDHGIETAADRMAVEKPAEGNLWLRAYHQGGNIVIEVADDGRGLPREKILAKAIERGLVGSEREAAEMPDHEVYNLIFQPGFSTAEKVTDISGRGVGMDVVRRNIEALRGKVEIDSTPGEGTVFKIRLPLTMAIIDGMVVRVGSQRYVVPTLSIEQSFQPTPDDLHTAIGRGEMASIRGSLLPIYRLNSVFNLNEGCDDPTEALLIVLEANESRCCLLVDEILGQQQVVIKSLGQGVGSLRGVSGGAILGDGRVALILDVAGLVDEATRAAA